MQVKHLFHKKVWRRNTGYVSLDLKLEFVSWMTRKRKNWNTFVYSLR